HLNKYMLQSVTGQGLLTSENPLWRQQRRLMQPAFHRHNLANFIELMSERTNQMLARWDLFAEEQRPFDIAKEMMELTLDIVTSALFSYDIHSQTQTIGHAVNTLIDNPKPQRRIFKEALAVLDNIVYGIITQRRQETGNRNGDLLDMLLQARYEDGSSMSNQQVRDEVMSLLIAGHETTANTLSWLWYILLQHPSFVAQAETEIAETLQGQPLDEESVHGLPTIEKIIKEAMRLYPSAWSISRRATHDDVIDGYAIPAGAIVALSPYVLHRHPGFWQNPEQFDPQRFTPEQESQRHRFAYIPFGAGARKCIGDQFALMESSMIVPMVLQRHRLQLVPNQKVEEHALVTLRPRHGIQVITT
ncbi:MAG: cytochrome P450, partial [Anaerolineales bacterium]|nr:cytochrome P450 [Anaerolineales bacterium]